MSRKKPSLHIVIPGLQEAIDAITPLHAKAFNALNTFFSKATVVPSKKDYPHLLASLFQSSFDKSYDVPTAALAALNICSKDHVLNSHWIQAHPVLLQPDRDRLVLHPVEKNFFREENKTKIIELTDLIRHFFSSEFPDIHFLEKQGWLMSLASGLTDIKTTPLADAVGRNIDSLLPTGTDSKRFHAVLNEMQMLLYQHNSIELGFNSFWFEGAGRLSAIPSITVAVQAVHGKEPLLDTFADYFGALKLDSPLDMSELPEHVETVIVVFPEVLNAIFYRTEQLCMTSLTEIDSYLTAYLKRLNNNNFQNIVLYGLNGHVHYLRKIDLYKFWKSSRMFSAKTH